MTLEFWVTAIIVTATPGTGALFTIAAGLARGARWGLIASAGCTVGIVPHLALALSGAAALLAASPLAFAAIKWLGVAYLLYLAWGSWRQSGAFTPEPGDRAATVRRTISSAVMVNLLNPKLTLFFFVFLPLFVDPAADGALFELARLGVAFMAVTLLIFAGYGVAAARLRRHVIERPGVMRTIGRVFAGLFVLLAVLLALTRL